GDQLIAFNQLTMNIRDILTWFRNHPGIFPNLEALAEKTRYEKNITTLISSVLDENGQVRDNASKELIRIRGELAAARQALRKTFEHILRKLNKQGYLADISEGFLNGRRTVAIFAEHKRIVKGILHGESDTSRTVFIEPE